MRDRVLAARAAGRDPASVACALNMWIRLEDQPEDRAADEPDAVTGPPKAIIERLRTFAGMGLDSSSSSSPAVTNPSRPDASPTR
jgi:hypothetical protein